MLMFQLVGHPSLLVCLRNIQFIIGFVFIYLAVSACSEIWRDFVCAVSIQVQVFCALVPYLSIVYISLIKRNSDIYRLYMLYESV